jgi:DNA-binding NarL/FixJ family response regulator
MGYHHGLTRILLVDDNTALRTMMRETLQMEASLQIVDEAEDGLIAIEKVGALRPDIVIMDIHMPHVNGIAATKHITTYYPACLVIGVSTDNDRCTRLEMEKAGSSAFISKEDFGSLPDVIKGITRMT